MTCDSSTRLQSRWPLGRSRRLGVAEHRSSSSLSRRRGWHCSRSPRGAAGAQQRAAARGRHTEGRRHRGARRRRRARQAWTAGARLDRGRLRAVRGRRRRRRSARSRQSREPPAAPSTATAAAACAGCRRRRPAPASQADAGPAVTAHRLPRARAREPQARRAGGAGVPRRQGGDAELRRHLRHRPVAEAARPVHAQRRRRAPGAEPDGHAAPARLQLAGDAAAARGGECGGDVGHQRGEQRHGRRGRGELPARSGPRPATPGSRRWRPASCRGFQEIERNQSGYIAIDGLFAIVQDARPAAGTQERHPPFRRADDHDRSRSGCSMASSTPPTAPTSASTPSTPRACAR